MRFNEIMANGKKEILLQYDILNYVALDDFLGKLNHIMKEKSILDINILDLKLEEEKDTPPKLVLTYKILDKYSWVRPTPIQTLKHSCDYFSES